MEKNFELVQGYKEITTGAIEGIKTISSVICPLLEYKDKENKRLKRLLRERLNVDPDEILLE